MGIQADKVVVQVEARVAEAERKIDGMQRKFDAEMDKMRRSAGLMERSTVKSFGTVATAGNAMASSLRSTALALASVAGAAAGIRLLADFAQSMSTVKAITQATDTQFAALTARARELGATTRFSATQAAEGMIFLARAGFDTDEVLGSIEGTLKLAQAGGLELGAAADIASNVLQGFRLEVAETSRVVDVLALAANSSNTDVTQLGEAMKYAGPIAAGLGVSVEDTAAAVSALSDAGLQGAMAGTGLRRVMIGLEKQGSQGEKVLKKYGLTMEDIAMSSTGSLANSLQVLSDASISTADAITLFGLRGGPAFEVLKSSIPKVKELTVAYTEAGGTADRVAKVMDQNLNGALLAVNSRMQELLLALGDAGAEDALIQALKGLQELLTIAAENADIVSAAIIALSVRALIPLAARAIPAAASALASMVTSLIGVSSAGAAASASLAPLTIAIAAAAAAYVYLARSSVDAEKALASFNKASSKIDEIRKAIADDTRDLADVNSRLVGLINEQGSAAELTARKEIAAITDRIAKNKELLSLYEVQARADLEAARAGADAKRNDLSQALGLGRRFDYGANKDALKTFEETRKAQLDEIRATQDAGKALTDQQRRVLDLALAYDEVSTSIAEAQTRLDGIKKSSETVAGKPAPIDPADVGGPDPFSAVEDATDKQRKAAQDALKELERALLSTYDAERAAAEETYNERLKAIQTLGLKDQEAANQRLAAEIAYQDELKRIQKDETTAKDEKLKRDQALVDKEQDLLKQTLDARDRAAGRSIEIAIREFERRKEILEKSFADTVDGEARKNEALAALEEERQNFLAKAREQTTGFETKDPVEAKIEQIRRAAQIELDLEKEKLATLADYQDEFNARRIEIETATEEQIAGVRREALAAQLSSAGDFFGGLAGLAKSYAGEQSTLYRTLFGIEQAFRAAQALIAAPAAAAKALAEVPYPFNLAASALVYAQAIAQVAKIGAVSPGFAQGVIDLKGQGGPKSDTIQARLSPGESVITAEGTRRNRGILEDINRGIDVQEQLRRLGRPVALAPAFMTSGGRVINVGGSSLTVQGNVSPDTLPALREALDQMGRDITDRIDSAIKRDKTVTTPRHERSRILK